jgi:sortase A
VALLGAVGQWEWMNRSHRGGAALIQKLHTRQHKAAASAICVAPTSPAETMGLLEVPAISLRAPVEEGTGDAVLAVAVGHDQESVWPGSIGNSILEAHDVSYFSSIDELKAGDVISFQDTCTSYQFVVGSHRIVKSGSPIYDTPAPSLTLVTCWPTDALWFTPNRYVVTATEVARHSLVQSTQAGSFSTAPVPQVSTTVPPTLAAQGVTLATNYVPMGTLQFVGTPSSSWKSSPTPLAIESSALEEFIGGLRALGQGRIDWWQSIAPRLAVPTPLLHAAVSEYLQPLEVVETADGDTASQVDLSTQIYISGGSAPGYYSLSVEAVILQSLIQIVKWQLVPS